MVHFFVNDVFTRNVDVVLFDDIIRDRTVNLVVDWDINMNCIRVVHIVGNINENFVLTGHANRH